MNPDAILIDWNGTLSHSLFWEHLNRTSDQALFNLWSDTLFTNRKEEINRWMRGEYSTEDAISFIAEKTSSNHKKILTELIKSCEEMKFTSNNLPKLITELRNRGIKVLIATNNMDCFTRWTIPALKLDLLFDEILNSFYLRALKHDLDSEGKSLFFQDFFERTRIDPENCFFFDDSEDKMGVINRLGVKFVQIKDRNGLEGELSKILTKLELKQIFNPYL